jgi:hypothetical protein
MFCLQLDYSDAVRSIGDGAAPTSCVTLAFLAGSLLIVEIRVRDMHAGRSNRKPLRIRAEGFGANFKTYTLNR